MQEIAGRMGDFVRVAGDNEKGREYLKRAGMGVTENGRGFKGSVEFTQSIMAPVGQARVVSCTMPG